MVIKNTNQRTRWAKTTTDGVGLLARLTSVNTTNLIIMKSTSKPQQPTSVRMKKNQKRKKKTPPKK